MILSRNTDIRGKPLNDGHHIGFSAITTGLSHGTRSFSRLDRERGGSRACATGTRVARVIHSSINISGPMRIWRKRPNQQSKKLDDSLLLIFFSHFQEFWDWQKKHGDSIILQTFNFKLGPQ